MARFDAAADPKHALDRGFYVPRPGRESVDRLVGRLELQPATMHLVVGGIGSGKTTQLLVAQQRLSELQDTRAIYIDVSKHQDLSKLKPGVLAVLTGLALCKQLPETDEIRTDAERQFRNWAEGYGYYPEKWDDDIVWVPGLLAPPTSDLERNILEMMENLKAVREALATKTPHIITLFDSMDRINNLKNFSEIIEQDLMAMSSIGIGVVAVGPIHSMYGLQRMIAERFRYTYHQSSVDVQQDAPGRDFLLRVLRQRASEELLPDPVCQQLIALSGGVLRDLISLARQAIEEAYLDREDTVTLQHVATAADTFGRSLMIGLTAKDIEVLQRVLHNGSFVETSEQDLALLATRQVLEYKETELRYAVHPTLEPLLKQLTGDK